MLVKTFGSAVYGVEAITITIELNISGGGKPFYLIVGLPDNAVRESMQRVEAALQTNNFRMPRQKIIVNMAPADIRKEGSAYNLPIALAILAGSGQMEWRSLRSTFCSRQAGNSPGPPCSNTTNKQQIFINLSLY